MAFYWNPSQSRESSTCGDVFCDVGCAVFCQYRVLRESEAVYLAQEYAILLDCFPKLAIEFFFRCLLLSLDLIFVFRMQASGTYRLEKQGNDFTFLCITVFVSWDTKHCCSYYVIRLLCFVLDCNADFL
uniref:Uncharacterized protein n=1 Tax=Rhizophora mucronata TaxID=61149 RepID=A0A2P2Q940_RHIMU